MTNEVTVNQQSGNSPRLQSICAYSNTYIGIVFTAIACILLCRSGSNEDLFLGIMWLVAAILVLWLAWGLLEGNEQSWKLFQGAGAVLTGGTGIVLGIYGAQDASRWSPESGLGQILLWLLGGVVLFIWAIGQLSTRQIFKSLWQVAAAPLGIAATWYGVQTYFHPALTNHQILAFIAALLAVIVCTMVFRLFVRPDYHVILASIMAMDDKIEIPRHFPTKAHELLARGHFCELFELPCTTPCPLTTKVAAQYQTLKLKYQDSPQVLETLEKAYAVLITPRSRELCSLAHEIMDGKKKTLGKRRFETVEIILWAKLWGRMHGKEFKGDPQRIKSEKQRLMKEF